MSNSVNKKFRRAADSYLVQIPHTGTWIIARVPLAINGFDTDEQSYANTREREKIVPPTVVVANLAVYGL